MRWAHQELWYLALIPVIAVALFIYGHLMRKAILARVANPKLMAALTQTLSPGRRLFKQLLLTLGLILVTLAALRPQYGRRPEPLRQTGIDLAVAFDISKSMLARDVYPARLDAARQALLDLLDGLHGHRVALVPFAGIAFTQTPLTADKSAIRLYMKDLDPKEMPVGGTHLAAAIREGVELLTGREDRGERAGRSRALLLITDGEDVAEDAGEAAKEAAKAAAEAGVQIYALGVGTRLGEPIPILNHDGSHAGYQKDKEGKPIYSKLNLDLLGELTRLSAGGAAAEGRVFTLDEDTPTALAEAFGALQKSTLEGAIRHRHSEKFQYALILGLLLLALEAWISERAQPLKAALRARTPNKEPRS
ncbi:VWA domain-containing protein [Myxococcota bacterium]|nr:VWA domain-containing protein [Myxococcota bacterium]